MTLHSAVSNVAKEAGYSVDSVVVTSTDVTTQQLYAIANRVIQEMADEHPWQKLTKSASISLVDGTSSYALPGDFSHYHYDTFWNSSSSWRVLGPISAQEYAEIRGYGPDSTIYQRFQIRGVTSTQLLISPTPTAAETLIFEYIAARPVRPKTWTASLSVTSGDYIFYNGNYYLATATGTTGATPPTHTTGSVSDGGITWSYSESSYTTFLKDTDEPIFNQRILEQGILERFAEIKGFDVVKRFADQVADEFAKQEPGRIIYMDGEPRRFVFAENGRALFGRGN